MTTNIEISERSKNSISFKYKDLNIGDSKKAIEAGF